MCEWESIYDWVNDYYFKLCSAGTRDKKIDKKKLQTIQLVIATHKTVQQLHELAKHRQPDFIEFPTVNPFKHQLFSIKQQPKRLADLNIFLADLLRHLREYKIKILHWSDCFWEKK